MVKVREAWVLQSMGSQKVGHDLATEQQQTFEYVTSKAKNNAREASLVVQWFRICLPMQGTWI